MLIISLEFLTGRFHATPWGRNVNEGLPEWPPSPYRIIRALFDSWKRKYLDLNEAKAENIFSALASSSPKFHLPLASPSYIKTYMSENSRDISDKQLIYDAFITVRPTDRILLGWEDVSLTQEVRDDLNRLLSRINYLGRSESWARMELYYPSGPIDWNCFQMREEGVPDGMHSIEVAVAMPKDEYDAAQPLPVLKKGKHKPEELRWIDALKETTEDMFKRGDSIPPAFKQERYAISDSCFFIDQNRTVYRSEKNVTSVLFALESKILPLVLDTVIISERVHRKLMGINRRITGDQSKVSSKFSGRDSNGKFLTGHRHVSILPWDADNDGRIDHMLIAGKDSLDQREMQSLNALKSLWQSGGKPDIRIIPIQWGTMEKIAVNETGTRFTSETPFVPTRHYRKGRGDFNQWLINEVKRESANHGLPAPISVRRIQRLEKKGHSFYWAEFVRGRKGDQRRSGYGFEIIFAEPVQSPFSIGYGAHFGLGLFSLRR